MRLTMCSLMGTLAGAGAPTGGIAPADADAGGRRAGCRRLDLGDDAADPKYDPRYRRQRNWKWHELRRIQSRKTLVRLRNQVPDLQSRSTHPDQNAPAVQMPCRRGPSSWAARAGHSPKFSTPRPSERVCANRVGRRLIWLCSCCCVCDVERGTRHCRPMAMVLARS